MMVHAPDSDAMHAIPASDADVMVDLSYMDLGTGEPALSHVRRALEHGRHVVTTNKHRVGHAALRGTVGPGRLRFLGVRYL